MHEALRCERERREAEVRALHNRRQRLLLRAIDRVWRAQEIRAFVEDVGSRLPVQGVEDEETARWKAWALGQADAMDMRVQVPSVLAEWVRRFELGTEEER